MMHAAKEASFLCTLLSKIDKPLSGLIVLYSNNQSAIVLTKSGQFHACTKHIDIRYHYVREAVEGESVELTYCPTEFNAADQFTKALRPDSILSLSRMIGVHPLKGEC